MSLNELMQRHEGLVHLVIQRQWLLTLPYEEALHSGRRGLWQAILGYDPGRGTTFSTYSYKANMWAIWWAVKGEQHRLNRQVLVEVLGVYCYQMGSDPAWLINHQEISESLLELVKRLHK